MIGAGEGATSDPADWTRMVRVAGHRTSTIALTVVPMTHSDVTQTRGGVTEDVLRGHLRGLLFLRVLA